MKATLTVLGLESSCDDTAAAVVRLNEDRAPEILSSVVHGQSALHAEFGGVVPEIAARAHAEKLDLCVEEALNLSGLTLGHVDLIAATAGPGLIGGVLSGVMCAKGLAFDHADIVSKALSVMRRPGSRLERAAPEVCDWLRENHLSVEGAASD